MKSEYYLGDPPEKCQLCNDLIGKVFVEGKTKSGSWVDMCIFCHVIHGLGFGTGHGHEYTLYEDGKFRKTRG